MPRIITSSPIGRYVDTKDITNNAVTLAKIDYSAGVSGNFLQNTGSAVSWVNPAFVEIAQVDVNGTSVTLTGISETYDLYLLVFSLAYSSGGVSASDRLQLQLNSDTTASYDYTEINTATISNIANATSFDLSASLDVNSNYAGCVWIGVQNGTSRYLSVSGCTPTKTTHVFLGGILDSVGTQLTAVKLTFFNTRTYTGHVKLFGVDLT